MIALLLDRGADIDATDGTGWQALDLAVWSRRPLAPASSDFHTARLLLSRGATCDLTIAAALGDLDRVTALLDQNPACLREVRPWLQMLKRNSASSGGPGKRLNFRSAINSSPCTTPYHRRNRSTSTTASSIRDMTHTLSAGFTASISASHSFFDERRSAALP